MVKALTRQLLAFQLAAMLVVAAALHFVLHLGWGAALGVGLLVLAAVRIGISINNFILAWQYHSETPREYRLNVPMFLRMFCVEFLASMWTTSWAMPFKGFANAPIDKASRLPVLLIHGYGCNSGYCHRLRRPLDDAGLRGLLAFLNQTAPAEAERLRARVPGLFAPSPLSPVLGGEGLGVRGTQRRHPLTPDPSGPQSRGRGEEEKKPRTDGPDCSEEGPPSTR